MDAIERWKMLLKAKSGQDSDFHEKMPVGGYGQYSMYDLDYDSGGIDEDDEKKVVPKPKPKTEQPKKVVQDKSGSKFLDILQAQNQQYAKLFSTILERLPTQKDFFDLNNEVNAIKSNQEQIGKAIEELQPPSPEQKSEKIQDANPDMVPVADYWRDHYSNQKSFNGTLDSISGKSFRDYLNL